MMMADYGMILREERKKRGMTIEEMAEYLDVCVNAVSCWERGKRYPDEVRLKIIRDRLGIELPERGAV